MEKKGPYFTVGLFVILGFLGLVGFALWLAGSIDTRRLERYVIHFTDSVSGLKEGASVQYRGVDVGKVRLVELKPERRNLIRVEIEIDPTVPVNEGTTAQLEVFGITGLVFISLSTDPGDTEPPLHVEGERYPVIRGQGTQLSKLMSDIPNITRKLLDTSERINRLFSDDNLQRLDATIANVESMTRDLNGLLSQQNVAAAGVALENTAEAMQNISTLSRQSQELVQKLQGTADSFDAAAASLNRFVEDARPHVTRFTKEGLSDIQRTSRSARKMADSIRETADQLKDDPSQLLFPPESGGTTIPR